MLVRHCGSVSHCSGGCWSIPFPLLTFVVVDKVGNGGGPAMAMSLAGVF